MKQSPNRFFFPVKRAKQERERTEAGSAPPPLQYQAVAAAKAAGQKALVIGGGYIGLELSAALAAWELPTTVVMPESEQQPALPAFHTSPSSSCCLPSPPSSCCLLLPFPPSGSRARDLALPPSPPFSLSLRQDHGADLYSRDRRRLPGS